MKIASKFNFARLLALLALPPLAVWFVAPEHVRAQQIPASQNTSSPLAFPGEKHLRNIRQLTFGGQNAEAYFSADDKFLIFQHQDLPSAQTPSVHTPCDQIFTIPVDTPNGQPATPTRVSNGKGRTTCSYFFPSGDRILYSSTFAANAECPSKPDYSHGYVWPIYDTYEIYTAKRDGSDLRRLTDSPGYDAETTISR